jgi:DNA mismatch repair protein MutS2
LPFPLGVGLNVLNPKFNPKALTIFLHLTPNFSHPTNISYLCSSNKIIVIYPESFEKKIGAEKIRELAMDYCIYDPGREDILNLSFSDDYTLVLSRLKQVNEFKQILESEKQFPIENFIDISESLKKARVVGRFLEEFEVFNIKKAIDSVRAILSFLKTDEEDKWSELKKLASEVKVFPVVSDRINAILNKQGHIKDNASKDLQSVRRELAGKQAAISKKLNQILNKARQNGLVDEDTQLSIRNGRAVIPISAAKKRMISGYVHDESSTGKTAFVEPAEIVEANNELRELENLERREMIKILSNFTDFIRPYIDELSLTHIFLAKIDSTRARAKFAQSINAILPRMGKSTEIDWRNAVHPLLLLSFRDSRREKDLVPLSLKLDKNERILLISGPNAGGKSVCLQTVGLLQYMFQCGFLVPVEDGSVFSCFRKIFLDMGDEQSIEDDLSTYSSHLTNMKFFTRNADEYSMILIDEFGSGTEPNLGGAIAESVLEHINSSGAFGLITTHYSNLKHFAASAKGIVNGAMLYDTGQMKPLFKLVVGRPGSSFAFEMARKIGLSEDILKLAQDKLGKDHVDFEKHLKDLIRDKRYWENKRNRIRIAEKRLNDLVEKYDTELNDTEKLRKKILKEAQDKAEAIMSGANKQIENTIREIKESEAEKERTREARKKLETFRESIKTDENSERRKAEQDELKKKIEEVRRQSQRSGTPLASKNTPKKKKKEDDSIIRKASFVVMEGQHMTGEVVSVKGNKATVVFGSIRTIVSMDALKKVDVDKHKQANQTPSSHIKLGDWDVGKRKINFKPDIDIRGKRADEAMKIVHDFIDEAIMVQSKELRILHGKGNGILRELIRQYLGSMDLVEHYGDEHVERGGAGITLVKLAI